MTNKLIKNIPIILLLILIIICLYFSNTMSGVRDIVFGEKCLESKNYFDLISKINEEKVKTDPHWDYNLAKQILIFNVQEFDSGNNISAVLYDEDLNPLSERNLTAGFINDPLSLPDIYNYIDISRHTPSLSHGEKNITMRNPDVGKDVNVWFYYRWLDLYPYESGEKMLILITATNESVITYHENWFIVIEIIALIIAIGYILLSLILRIALGDISDLEWFSIFSKGKIRKAISLKSQKLLLILTVLLTLGLVIQFAFIESSINNNIFNEKCLAKQKALNMQRGRLDLITKIYPNWTTGDSIKYLEFNLNEMSNEHGISIGFYNDDLSKALFEDEFLKQKQLLANSDFSNLVLSQTSGEYTINYKSGDTDVIQNARVYFHWMKMDASIDEYNLVLLVITPDAIQAEIPMNTIIIANLFCITVLICILVSALEICIYIYLYNQRGGKDKWNQH